MRVRGQAVLGVAAVLGGGLALAGCDISEAGDSRAISQIASAERRSLEIRAEAAGTVRPVRVVEVKSKASGDVLRLFVDTGDDVDRGALLAEIDPRDVRNQLAQAEADQDVAQARLEIAEAQLQRTRELRESNVVTDQELERAALEAANARAQLVRAETNLELARERMGDVTIRAPINGTIIERTVEVGQIIQSASQNISGGTTLLKIADLTQMQIRALVDETDIGRIAPGVEVQIRVDAFPDRVFRGEVHKIEPQAVMEQNVTMFPLIVHLDNRDRLLKPGMNAEVAIEVARRENAVTIPAAAIVSVQDGPVAAAVLGMDEETYRTALQTARQLTQLATASSDGSGGESGQEAASTSADPMEECRQLFTRARDGNLSDAEQSRLAACRNQMQAAMRRPGGPAGPGGAGGPAGMRPRTANANDARPAIVFVQGPDGRAQPRQITVGLHDWEYVEVLRGLEEGEQVVMISVARLQEEQARRIERMRQNQSILPGQR